MPQLKIWDGSEWIEIKGEKGDIGPQGDPGPSPFYIGSSAPPSPEVKPIWFEPTP